MAVLDLNEAAAQAVADEINANGGQAIAVGCNVLELSLIHIYWQDTVDLLPGAVFCTCTLLRKVLMPPSLEMERAFITEVVSGAA